MRVLLGIVTSVAFFILPCATFAQQTATPTQSSVEAQSAPADEYFGRSGESVLGIRNRLNALDQKSDSDILSRGTSTELDDLQDAVLDWQQKYPADPWIPTAMARLVSDYARAGDASSPFATATLRVMLDRYPNTPQARAAVAAIGNEASPTGNSVLQSAVADTEVPTVPTTDVADVPIDEVSVLPESTDLLATVAWQAFNAGRADASDSVTPETSVGFDTTAGSSGDATVDGAVIDARTGAPIAGAIVFVAPDKDSNDVTQTPFATTGSDGSFTVAHVPMGAAYSIGDVSLAHAEFVLVQPPRGSGYIAYHGIVDAGSGTGQAGVIRLTSE